MEQREALLPSLRVDTGPGLAWTACARATALAKVGIFSTGPRVSFACLPPTVHKDPRLVSGRCDL